jgi:hypothetical protein
MESGLHFQGQGVTRPNVIHGEHYESQVNKRMRLTKSSIYCEEKCPKREGENCPAPNRTIHESGKITEATLGSINYSRSNKFTETSASLDFNY